MSSNFIYQSCQFCKKRYQSNGERKPKSFRKDGSVYQYYDSSKFCSRDCVVSYWAKKRSMTLLRYPEIIRRQVKKRKQTYKDNPEIQRKATEKRRQFYKDHPEIIEQMIRRMKQTYKDNPEIRQNAVAKIKQGYQTNPGIRKKRNEAYRQTIKDHPEIIEKAHDKAYQTMKKRGFVSKEEKEMIQLLKDKYGEDDVIEQYRDDRYKKPGTNYRYACDCYIRSLDLFIEFNGSSFHPSEKDRAKLEGELKRFKLKYPKRDIKECQAYNLLTVIEGDKIKQQVAKDNKLNYLIVSNS